jgi:hypothetical protein
VGLGGADGRGGVTQALSNKAAASKSAVTLEYWLRFFIRRGTILCGYYFLRRDSRWVYWYSLSGGPCSQDEKTMMTDRPLAQAANGVAPLFLQDAH